MFAAVQLVQMPLEGKTFFSFLFFFILLVCSKKKKISRCEGCNPAPALRQSPPELPASVWLAAAPACRQQPAGIGTAPKTVTASTGITRRSTWRDPFL